METEEKYMLELCRRMVDGLTSEEEEDFLADYFASNANVPDSLKDYQKMFNLIAGHKIGFTEKEVNQFAAVGKPSISRARILRFVAVAASLLVVCLLGWWRDGLQQEPAQPQPHVVAVTAVMTSKSAPRVVATVTKELGSRAPEKLKRPSDVAAFPFPSESVEPDEIKWSLAEATDVDVAAVNLLAAADAAHQPARRLPMKREIGLRTRGASLTDKEIVNEILSEVLYEVRSEQHQLFNESEDVWRTLREINKESCAN